MTTTTHPAAESIQLPADHLVRLVDKRSYAVVASTSTRGFSHSAGVLYARSGRSLFFSTMRSSRKARNIAANPHVAMTIPVRRVPIGGPPSAIMFQARASVLGQDDPGLVERAASGQLDAITSHGELVIPDGCFIEVELPDRVVTYGLGMSLWSLIRDPLNAAGWSDLGQLSA